MEETRNVERSDIWEQIYSVVKKIPREDVESDAADASSVASEIEELLLKFDVDKKRELLRDYSSYVTSEWNVTDVDDDVIEDYLKSIK